MNVTIKCDLCGEMQFNMSAENLIQLIGAATRYTADNITTPNANVDVVGQEVEKIPEKKLGKPISKVERMFGDVKSRIPIPSVIPEMPPVKPPKKPLQEEAYKGFLLIKCDGCGKVRGFYAKQAQSRYYCECGDFTPMRNLRPMYPKCAKCGATFKYMTNMQSETMSYSCLNCHAPVDLKLNKHGDTYVTI